MPPRPSEHIARLSPYEWEAMASDVAAAAGIAESEVVRFDTNTTSWPPVAWELTALDAPRLAANEYPHASNEPLQGQPGTAPRRDPRSGRGDKRRGRGAVSVASV